MASANQSVQTDSINRRKFGKLCTGALFGATTDLHHVNTPRSITSGDADSTITSAGLAAYGGVAVVDDLTALKALAGGFYDIVNMAGRTAVGDGGAGTFVWNSSDLGAKVTVDPQSGIYVPPDSDATGASGAWERVHSGMNFTEWFGVVADWDDATQTGTDDYTASQACIDYVKSIGGGFVRFPAAKVAVGATLTVNGRSIQLVGAGGISGHNSGESASQIVATHSAGPVIRMKEQSCSLRDIGISSSTARYTGAAGRNYGVQMEGEDTAGPPLPQVKRNLFQNVRITEQPNHGLLLIGGTSMTRCENVNIDHIVNGHGLVIDNGRITGRTNLKRPGLIQLENCMITRIDGHGLVIGNAGGTPIDDAIRVQVDNLEAIYCLEDHAKAIDGKLASVWVFGENIMFSNCAVQGKRSSDKADVHNAFYVAGRYHRYVSNRYINTNPFIMEIDNRAERTTIEILVDGGYIHNKNQGSGFYNPAILVHDDAKNVTVRMHTNSTKVASLVSTEKGGINSEVNYQDSFRSRKNYEVLDLKADSIVANDFKTSKNSIVLDAAAAGYLEFDDAAYGLLLISGNAGSAGAAMVHFKVQSAAFVNIVSSSGATISGSTGALTGTTGIDGEFTISAHTSKGRLYLENRLGIRRTYNITILNMTNGNYIGYKAV